MINSFASSALDRWKESIRDFIRSKLKQWLYLFRREAFASSLKNALFLQLVGIVMSRLKQPWHLTMRACVKWPHERSSRHSERCCPALFYRPLSAFFYPGLASHMSRNY